MRGRRIAANRKSERGHEAMVAAEHAGSVALVFERAAVGGWSLGRTQSRGGSRSTSGHRMCHSVGGGRARQRRRASGFARVDALRHLGTSRSGCPRPRAGGPGWESSGRIQSCCSWWETGCGRRKRCVYRGCHLGWRRQRSTTWTRRSGRAVVSNAVSGKSW